MKLENLTIAIGTFVMGIALFWLVSSETDIVKETFDKYPTLPTFEQYVTDNIKWDSSDKFFSNKPKTPEQMLSSKKGVCGDFAFLYKEYMQQTYQIESTVIAFKYYKPTGGTGLHAIGLFKKNGFYWVTENNRISRTIVPDTFTIKEFFDAYDVAWVNIRNYQPNGQLTDEIVNTKSDKELKEIAKNPNKQYRVKRDERYNNGDF